MHTIESKKPLQYCQGALFTLTFCMLIGMTDCLYAHTKPCMEEQLSYSLGPRFPHLFVSLMQDKGVRIMSPGDWGTLSYISRISIHLPTMTKLAMKER